MRAPDTKTHILDTAERLFAEQGFGATSLRNVITKARVNLAAVHYHFGSRDELIRAVLSRRIGPLNEERLRLLGAVEARAGKSKPDLEGVLEALIAPALRVSRDPERGGKVFMRLLGRTYAEPDETWQRMLMDQFGETVRRFTGAFQRALPGLPRAELFWRIHFVVGAMAHTMADTERPRSLSGGLCDPYDVEGIIARLVAFLAAGMRVPAKERRKRR